ncbi:MAG: DNA repair protein RecN [Candidatus Edwardsbacteria bacterium]
MLTELQIKDYALIENLQVEFSPGLNVLTGETGAGKSILIGAVGLMLGEKGDIDSVRTGANSSMVEGIFDLHSRKDLLKILQEQGIEMEESSIILKRNVNTTGKTKCYANAQAITLSFLKHLGDELLDMHGQHEHQSLLKEERHLDSLDGFGKLLPLRLEVEKFFYEHQSLTQSLIELERREALTKEKIDLYQFQIKEIEKTNLSLGEEESLERERKILENSEKLFQLATEAQDLLSENEGSIIEQLGLLENKVSEVVSIDERLKEVFEDIKSSGYQLEEASHTLSDYRAKLEFDPQRLEIIRDRLDLIKTLKKKYGGSIENVLQYAERIKKEIHSVERNEEEIANLKIRIEENRKELEKRALELSGKRKEIATKMSIKIKEELVDLGMEKAKFEVGVNQIEEEDGLVEQQGKKYRTCERGIDEIRFLISPNPGEELRPLAKIASGGEISRVMLALKTILAEVDAVPTLVFDEIDVGIGGRIAEAVGKKLREIAKTRQVLCITHLPQIACLAEAHYLVKKETKKGRTTTQIKKLSKEEQIEEIARMLGGEAITKLTREHAREMLKMAEGR